MLVGQALDEYLHCPPTEGGFFLLTFYKHLASFGGRVSSIYIRGPRCEPFLWPPQAFYVNIAAKPAPITATITPITAV